MKQMTREQLEEEAQSYRDREKDVPERLLSEIARKIANTTVPRTWEKGEMTNRLNKKLDESTVAEFAKLIEDLKADRKPRIRWINNEDDVDRLKVHLPQLIPHFLLDV